MSSKVDPYIDRFENNIYISSFKEIIVSTCFPMALTGSIFYIAANPPRGTNYWIFKIWLSSAVEVRDTLMIPYYLTWGMVSIVTIIMLPYKLSKKNNLNPMLSSVVSFLSFLVLYFAGSPSENFNLEKISGITGPNGLLTAFLISIICINILEFIESNNLYFNIASGISLPLSYGFRNLFPIMIIIPAMWAAGIILGQPLQSGITAVFGYASAWNSDLMKDIACSIIISVLYFIGMDGSTIKQPIYNVLMNQGGFGTLLPLILLFMFSYSKHLKLIGNSIIIPGLFNIPYTVIFAVPLILNPIYLIPFIILPVITTVINYIIISSGLLTITVEATYTMPVILSGYFSTTGQLLGVLVQILNFILSFLIYYPFFIYHEQRLLKIYYSKNELEAIFDSPFTRIKKSCGILVKNEAIKHH